MEKKAKVTKVTKFDKVDNYGNTSYSVEFENGDKGFFTTKSPDQKQFIIGNVADYDITEHTKKDNSGTYNKIKVPGEAQSFKPGAGKFQQDPKIQFISFAASYTKDIICAGKATPESFDFTFDKIYNKMISKL